MGDDEFSDVVLRRTLDFPSLVVTCGELAKVDGKCGAFDPFAE